MSAISTWSTTAASNNSASPDGWPEGMAPSGVNDSGREMMAAIRTQWEAAEWFDWGDSVTYASGTSFTIAADVTGRYTVKRRIRMNGSTTGTIYGHIVTSSFSSPDTTVTVQFDSGTLQNEALTARLGIADPASPSLHMANSLNSDIHYINAGAAIHRLGDRIFTGAATELDGESSATAKDWLTTQMQTHEVNGSPGTYLNGIGQSSVLYSVNNDHANSSCAATFGTQSLNFTAAGTSCIGVTGIVINNNATLATNSWGGYFEAHRMNSTVGGAKGVEIDVVSRAASEPTVTPWQQGQTVGLQIGAGAGLEETDATNGNQIDPACAIQIVANPVNFGVGLCFASDSINGTDGTSGAGIAISMAAFHTMNWYNSSEALVARIFCNNTDASAKTELRFASLGVQIVGESAQVLGYWYNIASAVNYFTVSAATTTNPPTLAVAGSDTNINLKLTTKGTGVLQFGTHSAIGAETVTGYITVADAGGTQRKLAVVS